MDELCIGKSCSLTKLSIAQSSPSFTQTYSQVERALVFRHRLNLPQIALVLRYHKFEFAWHFKLFLNLEDEIFPGSESIHKHEFSTGVELFTSIKGSSHNVISRHVDKDYASENPEEFLFCDLHGLLELFVLRFGGWRVPLWISSGNASAKAC